MLCYSGAMSSETHAAAAFTEHTPHVSQQSDFGSVLSDRGGTAYNKDPCTDSETRCDEPSNPGTTQPQNSHSLRPTGRKKPCVICGLTAVYTCPTCFEGTCSVSCVTAHKSRMKCPGLPDPGRKITLRDFTDRQLARDFHFLEDCKRVIGNVERSCGFVDSERENFGELSRLKCEARNRGICLQIVSSGMQKRIKNSSYFDPKAKKMYWRCEFQFLNHFGVDNFHVSHSAADENSILVDILVDAWASWNSNSNTETGTTQDKKEIPFKDSNENETLLYDLLNNTDDYILLYKAERLGARERFFHISLRKTLQEALKDVCFVTEFPVFTVVRCGDATSFPIVDDADEEKIRLLFTQLNIKPKKYGKASKPKGFHRDADETPSGTITKRKRNRDDANI